MASLRWSLALLLAFALGCRSIDAACDSADVCCRDCTSECPETGDRLACQRDCTGVLCSGIQAELCGGGRVCCGDCESECPGMPGSCEDNCVDSVALSCPSPPSECSTQGAVSCDDCATTCPAHPAMCEANCEDGVRDGEDCEQTGINFARSVADDACDNTQTACNIPAATSAFRAAEATFPVDLETCCRIAFGSCSGNVVNNHPCDTRVPGNYGTCGDAEGFQAEFRNQAEMVCNDMICAVPECAAELGDDCA